MSKPASYTIQIDADAGEALRVLDATGKAVLSLGRDGQTAAGGVDHASEAVEDLGRRLKATEEELADTKRRMDEMGRGSSDAAQKLAMLFHSVQLLQTAFGALSGVASTIGGVFSSMRGSIDSTAETFRQATLYGIDPSWLSEMTALAKAAGREMDDVLDLVRDVRERIGEAVREMDAGMMANTFVVAFKELGATEKDIRRWANSTEEAVEFVIRRMAAAGEESATLQMTLQEIASAGTEKFGPILAALGEDGVAGALRTVRAMGLSANEEIASMASEVSFELGLLGQVGEGLQKAFVAGILPLLEQMTDLALEFVETFGPSATGGMEEFGRNLSMTILDVVESALGGLYAALEAINDQGLWGAFTSAASGAWDTFTDYALAALYFLASKVVEIIGSAVEQSLSSLAGFVLLDTDGSAEAAAGFAAQGEAALASAREGEERGMGQGQLGGTLDALAVLGERLHEVRQNVQGYTSDVQASSEATDNLTTSTTGNSEALVEHTGQVQLSAQARAELNQEIDTAQLATAASTAELRAQRDALAEAAAMGLSAAEAQELLTLATINATAEQMRAKGVDEERIQAFLSTKLEAHALANEIEELNAQLRANATTAPPVVAAQEAIAESVADTGEAIAETTEEAKQMGGLFDDLGPSLSRAFDDSFDAIINGTRDLKGIWKGVGLSMAKQFTSEFINSLTGPGGLEGLFKNVIGDLMSWASDALSSGFKSLFSGIGNLFTGGGGGGGAGGGGGGGGFFSTLAKGLGSLFEGGFTGFIDNLGDFAANALDGLADFGANLLSNIGDFAVNALGQLATTGIVSLLSSIGFENLSPEQQEYVSYGLQAISTAGYLPGLAAGGIQLIGGQAMVSPTGGLVYALPEWLGGGSGYIGSGTGAALGTAGGVAGGFGVGTGIAALIGMAQYPDLSPNKRQYGALGVGVGTGALVGIVGGSAGIAGVGTAAGIGAGAFGGYGAGIVGGGIAAGFAAVLSQFILGILDAAEHFETFGTYMEKATHDVIKQIDAYAAFQDEMEELGYSISILDGVVSDAGGSGGAFSGYGSLISGAIFLADSSRQEGYNFEDRYGSHRTRSGEAVEGAIKMADQFAANLQHIVDQLVEQGMDVEEARERAMGLARSHLDEWGIELAGMITLIDPMLFQAQVRAGSGFVPGSAADQFGPVGGGTQEIGRMEAVDDVNAALAFIDEVFKDAMPVGLDARMIFQAGLVPGQMPYRYDPAAGYDTGYYGGGQQNYGSGGAGGIGGFPVDPETGMPMTPEQIEAERQRQMDEAGPGVGTPTELTFGNVKLMKEIGESDEEFNKRIMETMKSWEEFDAERAINFVMRWGESAAIIQEGFGTIWSNPDTYAGIDQFIDENLNAAMGTALANVQAQVIGDLFDETALAGSLLPVTQLTAEMAEADIDWTDPEQAAQWSQHIRDAFEESRKNLKEMGPAIEEAKRLMAELAKEFMESATAEEANALAIQMHGEEAVQAYYEALIIQQAIAEHGLEAVQTFLAEAERAQQVGEVFENLIANLTANVSQTLYDGIFLALRDAFVDGALAGSDPANMADAMKGIRIAIFNSVVDAFVEGAMFQLGFADLFEKIGEAIGEYVAIGRDKIETERRYDRLADEIEANRVEARANIEQYRWTMLKRVVLDGEAAEQYIHLSREKTQADLDFFESYIYNQFVAGQITADQFNAAYGEIQRSRVAVDQRAAAALVEVGIQTQQSIQDVDAAIREAIRYTEEGSAAAQDMVAAAREQALADLEAQGVDVMDLIRSLLGDAEAAAAEAIRIFEEAGLTDWLRGLLDSLGLSPEDIIGPGVGGGGGGGTGPGAGGTGPGAGGTVPGMEEFAYSLGQGITGFGGNLGLAVTGYRPEGGTVATAETWEQRHLEALEEFTEALREQPTQVTVEIDGDVLVSAMSKGNRLASKAGRQWWR